MDKESITQYAWIIITAMVFAALIIFATPFGDGLADTFVSLVNQQTREVVSVYDEESQKEHTNYMEQLFDVTDLQQAGLYKHNDASAYKYTWAELKYHNIVLIENNNLTKVENKVELVGDLIIDKNIETIKRDAFNRCEKLDLVRAGENIKTIEAFAFQNCTNLKTFIAGVSLNYIGEGAFNNCQNLENVYLNKGVSSIGEGAFFGCAKLQNIHFEGTIEDWNKITKKSTSLGSVKNIICNNGTIEL